MHQKIQTCPNMDQHVTSCTKTVQTSTNTNQNAPMCTNIHQHVYQTCTNISQSYRIKTRSKFVPLEICDWGPVNNLKSNLWIAKLAWVCVKLPTSILNRWNNPIVVGALTMGSNNQLWYSNVQSGASQTWLYILTNITRRFNEEF